MQEEFKIELNEILNRNLKYKSEDQVNAIKNIRSFTIDGKKVVNYRMIRLEWYLRLKINQFWRRAQIVNSLTSASKITNSPCTSKSK